MQSSEARTKLLASIESLISEAPDEALHKAVKALDDTPDDPALLYMIGNVFSKAENYGISLHLYKRCIDLAPDRPQAWNNYGMALTNLARHVEAREAFLNARKRSVGQGADFANFTANVALTYMEMGERRKAIEWAEKALAIDPQCNGAAQTLGFCSLALGDWKRGWPGYHTALGGKFRRIVKVADEPEWDGRKVDTLFVYGEQGLGDEIMMASCIPDAARDVGKLVLECDRRLTGLFRRSFGSVCDVYGTRKQNAVSWPTKYKFDAGIASGDLPGLYRLSDESFPGTPFLVADPERRLQWRALFDSFGPKPKIGICWTGGGELKRNSRGRRIPLDAFVPLMETMDAHWISLEYKDPLPEIERTGLPVRHFARAAQSDDYDDMAAMVAELDCVIGVHTAAVHLAGGLGVPAMVLLPQKTPWNWSRPSMPWYGSISLHKQQQNEPWLACIKRLANDPDLRRFRSARSRSVPCVRAIDSGDSKSASFDNSDYLALAELVSEPS